MLTKEDPVPLLGSREVKPLLAVRVRHAGGILVGLHLGGTLLNLQIFCVM